MNEQIIKDEKKILENNYRITLVSQILKQKLLMGYSPTGVDFDRLYDLNITTLERMQEKYNGEAVRFINKLKQKTK